jgi:hypothetical protein
MNRRAKISTAIVAPRRDLCLDFANTQMYRKIAGCSFAQRTTPSRRVLSTYRFGSFQVLVTPF